MLSNISKLRSPTTLLQYRAFCRTTRRRQQLFRWSSCAASEDDDESYSSALFDHVAVTKSRPRLEALREQLAKDKKAPHKWMPPQDEPVKLPSFLQQNRLSPEALVDSLGRRHSYLRISLTERCNLRCQYCMPASGVPLQPASHLMNALEILHLAKLFSDAGVDKIKLTGGEPLLRQDLVEIVASIRPFVKDLGMTTNGVTLYQQWDALLEAGLTSVNISLDTLDPDKFATMTRRPAAYFDKVWKSIEMAATTPEATVKLNCVVMRGINDHEIVDFCRLTEAFPNLSIRFIEWMPFNDNQWDKNTLVPYQELLQRIQQEYGQLTKTQDGPNDTTKWHTLPHGGRVGFITSMTEHFCGTCNRLRLTADGKLKVCLFGSNEVHLLPALRHERPAESVVELIERAVWNKPDVLGGHGDSETIQEHSSENRPMTLIGG